MSTFDFDALRPRALQHATRLTKNSDDAQDLVQETFVKIDRKADTYNHQSPVVNWMLRIMTRTYLDRLRHERRKGLMTVSYDAPLDGVEGEVFFDPQDQGPSIEKLLTDEAGYQRLVGVVREVCKDQTDMFLAVVQEDLTYEEAAVRFGVKMGTIRSRLHRMRAALAKRFTEEQLAHA